MVPREQEDVRPVRQQNVMKSQVVHEEPRMNGSKMQYNTYEKK
jgi:hypothetical protein